MLICRRRGRWCFRGLTKRSRGKRLWSGRLVGRTAHCLAVSRSCPTMTNLSDPEIEYYLLDRGANRFGDVAAARPGLQGVGPAHMVVIG